MVVHSFMCVCVLSLYGGLFFHVCVCCLCMVACSFMCVFVVFVGWLVLSCVCVVFEDDHVKLKYKEHLYTAWKCILVEKELNFTKWNGLSTK